MYFRDEPKYIDLAERAATHLLSNEITFFTLARISKALKRSNTELKFSRHTMRRAIRHLIDTGQANSGCCEQDKPFTMIYLPIFDMPNNKYNELSDER